MAHDGGITLTHQPVVRKPATAQQLQRSVNEALAGRKKSEECHLPVN